MRCPKCGFISFDNVESCLKCNKDISETTSAFQGTTYNTATPVFLKFSGGDEGGESQLENADDTEGGIEFADPDLEILVEEGEGAEGTSDIEFAFDDDDEADQDADIDFAQEFGGGTGDGDDAVQDDFDDADSSLDLGLIEEASDDEMLGFGEEEDAEPEAEVNLEIPDELSDISDLSPPGEAAEETAEDAFSFQDDDFGEEPKEEPAVQTAAEEGLDFEEPADELEGELDLGSLDMDLSFDDEPAAPEADEPAPAAAPDPAEAGPGMDDDLDLNLDLGGLSIHDER